MSVADFTETNATATRLVWTAGDPPTYQPAGSALDVAALPSSGSEKVSIGKEISRKVYKVFCDFVGSPGAPPFGTEDRVRLEGIPDAGDYEVLSVQGFEFGENLAIVLVERYE